MQTITIGGKSYNLCALPTTPGPAEIEVGMNDSAAVVTSPFTRVEQVQRWPGADFWDATVTLPPLTRAQAWAWEGFLAELRGKGNIFQLSDPRAVAPLGTPKGAPVAATLTTNNLPMTTTLLTRGWTASVARLLLPGDHFQLGYRLHRVCGMVQSDSSGNATLSIWPSLREQPADGTALVLARPLGLFRLAQNRRSIHWSPAQATTISFPCVEAR
jgi:hypothetical protein